MKTLADVQNDMSTLYDEVRNGAIDVKLASELANIAGKFLKAESIIFAREVFLAEKAKGLRLLSDAPQTSPAKVEARRVS